MFVIEHSKPIFLPQLNALFSQQEFNSAQDDLRSVSQQLHEEATSHEFTKQQLEVSPSKRKHAAIVVMPTVTE